MTATALGVGIDGIDGVLVEVQVAEQEGMVAFEVTGLPATTIREARHRVKSALSALSLEFPKARLVANFAPADLPKRGTCYDLPLAVAVLRHMNLLSEVQIAGCVFFGELSLDGRIRAVPGAVSASLAASRLSHPTLFVAPESADEAAAVPGVKVIPVPHLRVLLAALTHPESQEPAVPAPRCGERTPEVDLALVRGQHRARRALEVAAAGGHNLLMEGPPGCGKTLLARSLPSILPPMTTEESLEVTRIHSVARVHTGEGLVATRPFRAPHATSSYAALVGGGSPPCPGEVSLAHRGVLFLDETPEFRRSALEALRGPLEDRQVCVSRAGKSLVFPASLTLVCALNPCPCGHKSDPNRACRCSQRAIELYRSRISGPLLDRIDLHVGLDAVPPERLASAPEGEPSSAVRERVVAARKRQAQRNRAGGRSLLNAELGLAELERWASLGRDESLALVSAARRFGLTARSWHRVIKIARTVADLAGRAQIGVPHVAEALTYRTWDRDRTTTNPALAVASH